MTTPRRAATRQIEYALQVRGLRKTYRTRRGPHQAVDGLDLQVPAGGVHGFLGPNGSGKTTTIRTVLGLISADAGEVRVFDQPIPSALPKVIDRIGAIVEQPKFFPTFSGQRNLDLLARAIGVPRTRTAAVLSEVGLSDRRRDPFHTYSLGMKQRLAIAATLLKDPDLLIFDEPTNGLDPAGIHQIRSTLRGLADQGKTVLMSSHILSEVQQVADTVSIIGRGRLLAEGDVDNILAAGAGTVRVGIDDPARAADLLAAAGYQVQPGPDRTLQVSKTGGDPDPADITKTLARHELYVYELVSQRADLESVFLELTADTPVPPGANSPGSAPGPTTTVDRDRR